MLAARWLTDKVQAQERARICQSLMILGIRSFSPSVVVAEDRLLRQHFPRPSDGRVVLEGQ